MGGLEIYRELQSDLGYDIEFRQTGALKVIQTEEELDFAQQETERLKSQGYMVEILSRRDAQSLEPELSSSLQGCLYYPFGVARIR